MNKEDKFRERFTNFIIYCIGLIFLPGYIIFKSMKWIYYKYNLYERLDIETKFNKFTHWFYNKNKSFKSYHENDEYY